MIIRKKNIAIILISFFLLNIVLSTTQSLEENIENFNSSKIFYDDIIKQGYKENNNLKDLKIWYNSHPQIKQASIVKDTLTIKFSDDSYILLLDASNSLNKEIDLSCKKYDLSLPFLSSYNPKKESGYSALLLNPSEYLYGNRHCKKIINTLLFKGYNIVYLSNEDVDLSFIRYNLTSEIIYMNTHAGYWDMDGDEVGDIVVIGIGEIWTNETEQKYQFEYENGLIVKGMVGDIGFVCFTPGFITTYYDPGDMPSSLIYMATCHATYDESMALAFLGSGASAYMGWTQNTVFWTNSKTSVKAFRLFSFGFKVKNVCRLIGYGGLFNFLFGSKLTYFGDENYKLPDF